MSVPYDQVGRVNQKARTREALVAATRALLARGVSPTMEQAAAEAAVSRTTAYRYFPSLRALLVATYPHIDDRSLLGAEPPEDPLARLDVVARDQGRRILTYEAEMRTVLRLSLEGRSPEGPELPMQRRLRIGWIEDALEPLRDELGEDELRGLVLGIGATLGIESFVWLADVAGVPRDDAVEIMRANALGLLRGAL
jgi:AcrR family transcriptional regulator